MSFVREFFSPSDSYAAEQSLLMVTYLLGLTPFRLSGITGNRSLKISRIGYLNAVLQIIFFMFCFLHAFIKDESIVGFFFKSEISKVGDSLQKFIGMVGMLILFTISLSECRDVINLLHIIHQTDTRFMNIGVVFNYRFIMKFTHTKLSIVLLVSFSYLGSSLWLLFRNDLWPSLQALVSFFAPLIFLMSIIVLHSAFLMRLQQHFHLINTSCSSLCARMFLIRYFIEFYRELRHPRDIYDSLHLLFRITFLFGLIPFHVHNSSKKRELRTSFIGYFNIVARIVLFQYNFINSLRSNGSMVSYFFKTNLSNFTAMSQKFNGMLAMMSVLAFCLLRTKLLKKLIIRFVKIEEKFLNVGFVLCQTKSALNINLFIAFLTFLNFGFVYAGLFVIVIGNGYNVSITTAVTFFSPNFMVCGMVMLFYGMSYKITEYLRGINEVLKNLGRQWENKSIKTIPTKQHSLKCLDSFSMYTIVTKNPSEIVQESMEIHQLICEAANTANKYFTYQLLTIISIAFLIIVFDAYYVLETLLGKSKRESKFKTVEFVTFFSCQMILYVIVIISIVEGSNRAIKKSEKTGGIVHGLLNKTKDPEIKEKLQQFSMQLMHLKINFTAAGLFNVDRSLYFTISGALTTYLIILLQFTSNTSNTNASAQEQLLSVNGTYEPSGN